LECGSQFVADSQRISSEKKALIKRLLLERLSLRGICRAVGVSLSWLLQFIAELYEALPEDLNLINHSQRGPVRLLRLETEADEMWSFVQKKANKQWIWIALDCQTKQVIAFYVGDRSRKSAEQLWQRVPPSYRQQAIFYTDDWEAYKEVLPANRHQVCDKSSGRTNIIERFNCTLRQRVSRLVRQALSFSKSLSNHIGAIKCFICHYNLMIKQAVPSALLL
jgi:IS1 family transposase